MHGPDSHQFCARRQLRGRMRVPEARLHGANGDQLRLRRHQGRWLLHRRRPAALSTAAFDASQAAAAAGTAAAVAASARHPPTLPSAFAAFASFVASVAHPALCTPVSTLASAAADVSAASVVTAALSAAAAPAPTLQPAAPEPPTRFLRYPRRPGPTPRQVGICPRLRTRHRSLRPPGNRHVCPRRFVSKCRRHCLRWAHQDPLAHDRRRGFAALPSPGIRRRRCARACRPSSKQALPLKAHLPQAEPPPLHGRLHVHLRGAARGDQLAARGRSRGRAQVRAAAVRRAAEPDPWRRQGGHRRRGRGPCRQEPGRRLGAGDAGAASFWHVPAPRY